MSFVNLAWSPPSTPARNENSSRQLPALGPAAISVRTTSGDVVENNDGIDLLDGRIQIGFTGVLIIGLVLFYLWTRNVQGGG